MLEEEGFDVVGEAADGRKAVDLAREHQPDLVILDIKMPGMNGIRAAEIITRERIARGRDPHRVQPARPRRAGRAGRCDGVRREAVPEERICSRRSRWPSSGTTDFTRLEGEVGELEERLETRKLVERAKGKLQEQGLSEDDAYKLMQRAAMDRSLHDGRGRHSSSSTVA